MALLGYARVSTKDQDITRQLDALERARCERVFSDVGVSGMKASRPEWDKLAKLDRAADGTVKLGGYARPGDTIVVTELSRMGRSVRELVVLVDDLASARVGVRSLTQAIDTTPGGGNEAVSTLLLSVFAALAQIERDILVERTRDGLAAARARGRVGGRPRVLTDEKIAAAVALVAAGTPKAEVARTLGVNRTTLLHALAESGRAAV